MAEEIKETKAMLNASVAPENFDWDAFEGGEVYGGANREEIRAAYDKTLSKIVANEVVEGEVTSINKREVVVTIGGKSRNLRLIGDLQRVHERPHGGRKPDDHKKDAINDRRNYTSAVGAPYFFRDEMI